MLNPIFRLAKTRDEHLLIVGLLSLPGALTIDEGPADKLIAEHLELHRALPRSVDSYPEDETPAIIADIEQRLNAIRQETMHRNYEFVRGISEKIVMTEDAQRATEPPVSFDFLDG